MTIVGALSGGSALLLLSLLPSPPSNSPALAAWVEQGYSLLSWSGELLFIAVVCWGAGLIGLVGERRRRHSARSSVGLSALAVAVVALVVVLLALGRLVYPVYEIGLSAEVLALVVSTTYGAVYLAYLGFAVVAVALSWATSAGIVGRAFGLVAAIVFTIGSFPWLTPTWWNSVVAALLGAWGVFLAFATQIRVALSSDETDP
ncbi:hypothetical protein BH11ACT3_BH11ACT3_01870 [soil metagenome]